MGLNAGELNVSGAQRRRAQCEREGSMQESSMWVGSMWGRTQCGVGLNVGRAQCQCRWSSSRESSMWVGLTVGGLNKGGGQCGWWFGLM